MICLKSLKSLSDTSNERVEQLSVIFFARMCTNTFLQTHAEKRQLVAMEISISCHRLLYSTFPDMIFS